MTRSVYIVGGAGTGKSTFMAELLELAGWELGPLVDLHSKPNAKAVVTLRGHEFDGGLYLGCMRESFPGTDWLDRATSPTGEEWLRTYELPERIISEGATLATRRFITALHETTELLLVHLHTEDFVKELRFRERGSSQDPKFVQATATRSLNLARDMVKIGALVATVDTSEPAEWENAIQVCRRHLRIY